MAIINVRDLGRVGIETGTEDKPRNPINTTGGSGRASEKSETKGSDSTGTKGGTLNAIERSLDFARVPSDCVLASVEVKPTVLASLFASNQELPSAESLLLSSGAGAIIAARADWAARYPKAPPPILTLQLIGNAAKVSAVVIVLARPPMGYDPECDRFGSPFAPKSLDAQILCAALAMFFPDKVFMDSCDIQGEKLVTPEQGSMLLPGNSGAGAPFPWRLPFVNQRMVDFMVEYIQTTPDAFGSPILKQNFDATRAAMQAAGAGAAGVSAGPMVAAAAAAASFLWSAFTSLFNGCAEKPAWFQRLLAIVPLRDGSDYAHTVSGGVGLGVQHPCYKLWYVTRGTMSVMDGYAAVLARTGVKTPASVLWLLLGTGAAALALS